MDTDCLGSDTESEALVGSSILGRGKQSLSRLRYYIPVLEWLPQYKTSNITGDLMSGLTMSALLIPIAVSYAMNLAEVPTICGLLSISVTPLPYILFGSCQTLLLSPLASASLLLGGALKLHSAGQEQSPQEIVALCGFVTFLCGIFASIGGLSRLGFIDSIFSRPFAIGYLGAIVTVLCSEQLIPELGLNKLPSYRDVVSKSTIGKLLWTIQHIASSHMLTVTLSVVSLALLIAAQVGKARIAPRYPAIVNFPDMFIVIVGATILVHQLRLHSRGVETIGEIKLNTVQLENPFLNINARQLARYFNTALTIMFCGFMDHMVGTQRITVDSDYGVSPNRELVALGLCNLLGGLMGSLPIFGTYLRSKQMVLSGGRSPLVTLFFSSFVISMAVFGRRFLSFMPKPVLSTIVTVNVLNIFLEVPGDILYYCKARAYRDILIIFTVWTVGISISLEAGIVTGAILSVAYVLQHTSKSRIQILGRRRGTTDFAPIDEDNSDLEQLPGLIVIRIPEPLYFANTGELRIRLHRLVKHRRSHMHPSARPADMALHFIIFDVGEMTDVDASAVLVLREIVAQYTIRGCQIYFARLLQPAHWKVFTISGLLDTVGGPQYFVDSIEEALNAIRSSGYHNLET